MNYTLSKYIEPDVEYVVREEGQTNLISSISLAVCSIMLSLGGLLYIVQKSKCTKISFCGFKCDRAVDESL